MKGDRFGKIFLISCLVIVIGALPFVLRKRPIKDWVLVYLFNAATNGIIDKVFTKFKIVEYPVRLFPNIFKINILFDFIVYPFITILINQVTYKDKFFSILYKTILFVIPMVLAELWAEKKTSLIKWNKCWSGYHTLLGLTTKSLVTRGFLGMINRIDLLQQKNTIK